MIKLIVTDLDGTLLRSDKSVSEYTASVLSHCRENGIKIVFATARPIRAVEMLETGIEYDAAVYHNSAVISVDCAVVHKTGIAPETAKRLLSKASRLVGTAAEINDSLYANFDAEKVWAGSNHILTDFTDIPPEPVDKLIFMTTNSTKIHELEAMFDDDLYWEISENMIVMVMNKNARKLNAIKYVAGKFNIDISDIAAFGDDYNDIEMLRECGAGVAAGNAIDEVKAVAYYVCGSNDNDGVARWIEHNILNPEE